MSVYRLQLNGGNIKLDIKFHNLFKWCDQLNGIRELIVTHYRIKASNYHSFIFICKMPLNEHRLGQRKEKEKKNSMSSVEIEWKKDDFGSIVIFKWVTRR